MEHGCRLNGIENRPFSRLHHFGFKTRLDVHAKDVQNLSFSANL